VRVPDAQLTIVDAGAVAAFVQCLVAWISRRHDAGDLAPPPPTWRITENRWRAARHGMDASFGDLLTGGSHPAREVLHGLLAELEPLAGALGCADELAEAGRLARESGAARQREQFERAGARGLARWLADQY
jgi:carboxylate-amine ligase